MWRRKCQHTSVVLLEKFHEQRSLGGYSPQGHEESATTEHCDLKNHISLFFQGTFLGRVFSLLM